MSEDDSTEYNSGPFCEHWCHPADCDECRAQRAEDDAYARLLECAAAVLSFIEEHGSIDNHGHRASGVNCAECRLINDLEAALKDCSS